MDIVTINGDLLAKMFVQGGLTLQKDKEMINALNVFPVPDGDTGTNMSLTFKTAIEMIKKDEQPTIDSVAKTLSKGSLMGARGNSGVILSQIFRGFAKGVEGKEALSAMDFAQGLDMAAKTAYKAVMKPVEGTILTVIRETAEAAMEIDDEHMAFHDFFKIVVNKAKSSLADTPNHLDVLRQAGVVDAGGQGLLSILTGCYNAIIGEEIDELSHEPEEYVHVDHGEINPDDIEFQYCTEFILRGQPDDAESLRLEIYKLGDSMVFVQDEDLIKIHVHTNNPGVALEHALKYGELINIKIDNMKEQHRSINQAPAEKKKYGFVAVAMGEGFAKIFKDFGVDYVIEGGQTMNPSTEDLLAAVNKVNADKVFILPNNSNIILAANQTKQVAEKEVVVIPTKTIPQGFAALMGYEASAALEENEQAMTDMLGDVSTLQVTYAVRDTQFDGKDIEEGDILGIYNGKIQVVGKEVASSVREAIDYAIKEEEAELITIYHGQEVSAEAAEDLLSELEETYEDVDFEMYYGGQPLYYYIISVE